MGNSAAGSLESIETTGGEESSYRSLNGSTDSVISSSSCRAGTLWLWGNLGGILILSNHGKIGISTN